jgi:CBS-domain-containing membrane protein
MTDKIVSLTSKNTLKEATELFDRYGFRALPLLDDKKTLLGLITNKDMINLRRRDLE